MGKRSKKKARTKPPPKDLQELWDRVPKMNCKGKCQDFCGVIPCSKIEADIIEARSGPLALKPGTLQCSKLDHNGRCGVYPVRPLICRMWGADQRERCPHGCEPERWLEPGEGAELLAAAEALSGDTPQEGADRAAKMIAKMIRAAQR